MSDVGGSGEVGKSGGIIRHMYCVSVQCALYPLHHAKHLTPERKDIMSGVAIGILFYYLLITIK